MREIWTGHHCCKLNGRRAAEEELAAAQGERERMLPQLEEARWRGRQADKEAAQAKEAATAAQQVRRACASAYLSAGSDACSLLHSHIRVHAEGRQQVLVSCPSCLALALPDPALFSGF